MDVADTARIVLIGGDRNNPNNIVVVFRCDADLEQIATSPINQVIIQQTERDVSLASSRLRFRIFGIEKAQGNACALLTVILFSFWGDLCPPVGRFLFMDLA